jgi:hypothetical protein
MSELTVPQIDFSPLGNLPAVYKQAQADNLRQQTLAGLGQGGTADAQGLLKSGDLSLAQLGMTIQQRQAEAERQARLDAHTAERDKSSDAHQKFMEGIALRTANRADEGPFETAGQRAKAAGAYGIEQGTPEFKAYVLTGKLPDSIVNGGNPEVGLNPAYGVGADGKPAAIQFSKNGQAVQTRLPEGFSLSKEPIKIDMGTHIQLYDPTTRQPVGPPIPKNIAGVESEKVKGDAQGNAEVGLPQVLANSEEILKSIDRVQNHPGKQYSLGLYSKAPTIPGTSQADFRANLDQLQGQTFLQAYQTLRGGGAITDIEGKKGSEALARMNTAQTQASFDQAANEFREVVKAGMQRAKAKATGGAAAPAATSPADPLGIR